MAKNFLEQGVQGIHMFNYPCILFEPKKWRPNDKPTFDKLTSVLSQMGDLKTLAGTDKEYYFLSKLPIYAEANRPKKFHQTVSFTVFGHDARNAAKIIISFRQIAARNPHSHFFEYQPLVPPGSIDYYINEEKIELVQIEITEQPAGKIPSGFELDKHQLVEIKLNPRKIKNGDNILAFEIPHFPKESDPYVYFYELRVRVIFSL
jgi:hypothetical protein